ncbi:hypothetical protein AB0J47_41850 [Nocardia sp. NPDC049737]|uniref:hypothetical protein n=1 Tax=Nocardia sp. NPDC049737 TaxID=3154358 RepID=UPI0034217F2C
MTHASVTPLKRLAERWVVVLPGNTLYSPDGPVRLDDPDIDWDPELFRTKSDALVQLDRCRGEAEDIGLTDWDGQVCRLGEVGTVTIPAGDRAPNLPDLAAFNTAHPAPKPEIEQEFAVLLPGKPFRDYESTHGGREFTIYPDIDYAADRANDITEDWAPRLGVTDHQVPIVTRTITTTTGPWAPALLKGAQQ